jgi:cobyrinic acid a,c-diamide synthase
MPDDSLTIKGLVIAATMSGSGKTTLALGLMAALSRRGLRVAPFKVGPDFIDPGHHSRVTGHLSRNLDGWMLSREYNLDCFYRQAAGADVAVVEGVMGLFDGYDGRSEAGSTAQMAKWLGLPVLLVVNARSMARSAAALVQGFERFDREVAFAGVVFNNLGSQRHFEFLQSAMEGAVAMPCVGGIPRTDGITIPERHLGLVTREDHPLSTAYADQLAQLVESHLDLDRILGDLPGIPVAAAPSETAYPAAAVDPPVRIGVARDSAFCFYYEDNLEIMASCGAKPVAFSPIADRELPQDLDGIYLGGGYPELYAQQLSENRGLRRQIRDQSAAGMPIYAECGGLMYLCREVSNLDGESYPMCGCLPFQTRMLDRLKALGYREVTLSADSLLGPAGLTLRGHEFHYSEISGGGPEVATDYRILSRAGVAATPEGYRVRRTLGSYIHLHFGSNPGAAGHFVSSCQAYRRERTALS